MFSFSFLFFIMVNYISRSLPFQPSVGVQFGGIQGFHSIVQPSLPSISGIFSSPQTETLRGFILLISVSEELQGTFFEHLPCTRAQAGPTGTASLLLEASGSGLSWAAQSSRVGSRWACQSSHVKIQEARLDLNFR